MTESAVERRLKAQIEAKIPKALCLKLVCPGMAGVPDRMILLPHGAVVFAELKQPGRRERRLQEYIQTLISRLGFPVFSRVDSYERVDDVVRYCCDLVRRMDETAERRPI